MFIYIHTSHNPPPRSLNQVTHLRPISLVRWIRARRLAWQGHILRMGRERKLKHAVYEVFNDRQPGDLLMDSPPHTSWWDLCEKAFENDKESWKARVRALKQPRIQIDIGSHIAPAETLSFTISWSDRSCCRLATHAELQGRRFSHLAQKLCVMDRSESTTAICTHTELRSMWLKCNLRLCSLICPSHTIFVQDESPASTTRFLQPIPSQRPPWQKK